MLVAGCVLLLPFLWSSEGTRGKSELEEQRELWVAEYGELEIEDFLPEPIADEDNFFAAPVFATFASWHGAEENWQGYSGEALQTLQAMPNSDYLQMMFPNLQQPEGELQTDQTGLLKLDAWVESMARKGTSRPAEFSSDAAWLHALMEADEDIDAMVAALDRPRAVMLPHSLHLWRFSRALGIPENVPVPIVGNATSFGRALAMRARAAALAGDGERALQLTRVCWRLVEGFQSSGVLVGPLVGLVLESEALGATVEGISAGCWSDCDLQLLHGQLLRIDEETSVHNALMLVGFEIHLWPVQVVRKWKRQLQIDHESAWDTQMAWLAQQGPDGWVDANLANHLRLWRMLMVPNGPGDDLRALAERQHASSKLVRLEREAQPTPRNVLSHFATPTLGNISNQAAFLQIRRRQLLLAIATERYVLAHDSLPASATDLVPEFIDAIPRDPWSPTGDPIDYMIPSGETATGRYRLDSAFEGLDLTIPERSR